jgi:uncharacterized protein DUF1206
VRRVPHRVGARGGARLGGAAEAHQYDMTQVEPVRQAARKAARSDALKLTTRFGFLGYGLVHALIGWLALEIGWGRAPHEGDQSGAFRTLAGQPLGKVLLILVAVGLAAMTVWQLLAATVGHTDERKTRRRVERVVSAGRMLVYAGLAWTAFQVVTGAGGSSAEQQQHTTESLMTHPAGRWLVGVAGVAVAGVGIGMALYGLLRKFERNLRTRLMNEAAERTAVWLAIIGYAAKGIAFAIVGVLLVVAAVHADASRSRGLDEALRTLARQPFGETLLAIVAAGFFAFGAYCIFQARYRKV